MFGHFRRFSATEITNYLIKEEFCLLEERAPGFPVQTVHDALACSFSGINKTFMEDMSQKTETQAFRLYSDFFTFILKYLCTKKYLGKYWFGIYEKTS